jgi:hypothetical protein
MFLRRDHIEYFDSYAQAPEAQRRWLSKNELEELGQGQRLLYNLLESSGLPVYYNRVAYQKDKSGYNSCGRWVCARLMNKDLTNTEFNKLVLTTMNKFNIKETDDWVCYYTGAVLGK